MTPVILQFPDLTQLAKFRFTLKEAYLEMNVKNLTISCDCSSDMINDAVMHYGARVLPAHKTQNTSTTVH